MCERVMNLFKGGEVSARCLEFIWILWKGISWGSRSVSSFFNVQNNHNVNDQILRKAPSQSSAAIHCDSYALKHISCIFSPSKVEWNLKNKNCYDLKWPNWINMWDKTYYIYTENDFSFQFHTLKNLFRIMNWHYLD